jgi:hypothetical protein
MALAPPPEEMQRAPPLVRVSNSSEPPLVDNRAWPVDIPVAPPARRCSCCCISCDCCCCCCLLPLCTFVVACSDPAAILAHLDERRIPCNYTPCARWSYDHLGCWMHVWCVFGRAVDE